MDVRDIRRRVQKQSKLMQAQAQLECAEAAFKKKKLPPTPEQSRRGRGNRNKGKVYERKIANFYKELGFDAKRTIQSRQGYEGCDVTGTPYWVECKHTKSIGIVKDWWEQATGDVEKRTSGPARHVVLHIRENNSEDLVVISRQLWSAFIRDWVKNEPAVLRVKRD